MSIYSGFAKRSQETIYNRLVYKTLEIFANFALDLKAHRPVDEQAFSKKIVKAYKALNYFEKHKHLDPHMSNAFSSLARIHYFDLKERYGGSKSFDKSMQSSNGFLEGISQFRASDDHSHYGSEKSITQQSNLFGLETIKEKTKVAGDGKNFEAGQQSISI